MLFESVLASLKVWLVPFVYEFSKWCSGIFVIWRQIVPFWFGQVKKIWPVVAQRSPKSVFGDPPGDAKIRQGVPLRDSGFRKTGREKRSVLEMGRETLHALRWWVGGFCTSISFYCISGCSSARHAGNALQENGRPPARQATRPACSMERHHHTT